MKKIMLLGGNAVQITCTKAAKAEGYHVISVDYLPDNPAHRFADEYHNVSTIDREKVLGLAEKLGIDGIVSYASDVSAPTAAYVAEKLGLPTNPLASVEIMTSKDRFRAFLKENGFAVPKGEGFTDYAEALRYFRTLNGPAVVKPVDSSGSKGVSRVDSEEAFPGAWEEALSYSRSKRIIVEQFIVRKGYQIDGDIFMDGGKIVFWGICDQHHDDIASPYAPSGHSYPPTQDPDIQKLARAEVERALRLLHMHMGAYNLEYIVGEDGRVYILEIGPRNGGNMITDAVCAATGVNLASCTVRQAVGDDVSSLEQKLPYRCAASYVIHSRTDGVYAGLEMSEELRQGLCELRMTVRPGDRVRAFRNGGDGIGTAVFAFDNVNKMCDVIDHMEQYLRVLV